MALTDLSPTTSVLPDPAADDVAYTALREECALFDRSSSTIVRLDGVDAEDLLQQVSTRDMEYLSPERSTAALVLRDDGELVDLVTIYRFDESFLVESSPGNGDALVAHLREQAGDLDVGAGLHEPGAALTSFGVEGPFAWHHASRTVARELVALPLDTVIETDWDDRRIMFCRAGVTGEYGYRYLGDPEVLASLAPQLAADVVVGGPEVLATAMLEVRHPTLTPGISASAVVALGASWLVDPAKEEFVGRDAFCAAYDASVTTTFGFTAEGTDPIGTGVAVSTADGHDLGEVVVSRFSPAIGKVIGLASLQADVACVGLDLAAGERLVTTVASPFIVPKSWKTPIV